ncbi:chemotaxis protein CheA [Sporomusaceae bacterium FL31]|nr:chemotaxis protein CheA [Sporomusaceae bacterium FL31]GCE34372.1 chemotaxis protein CheA [Sporomusaceae bacterium]
MKPNYELLQEFIEEAKAHIGSVEAGLLRMGEDECDADCVNEMFRAVHSIKGTAGFFELTEIVELSHAIETLFGKLRDQEMNINPTMIDALLTVTDVLKELVLNPELSTGCDITPYVTIVKDFLPAGKRQETDEAGADFSAWDVWNQLTDLEMQEKQMAAALPAESFLPSPAVSQLLTEAAFSANGPAKPGEPTRPMEGKTRTASAGDTVRVSVALLDDLLNMVGEMVLRRNQLLRIAQNTGKDVFQLDVVAQGIDTLTTNLQEKVMKTRMQPVANVFNKFPRIVRELSRKLGKEVELEMAGLSVELDRSIIEALIDPITHLVRNALDHGIESPRIRVAGNKPPDGKLVLHAYHESGRVIIDVRDDGAGIDIEVIRAKVLQKGWISEKEAGLLSECDILNFIMRPGFSTAQEVTDLSGRGVGMDVVKTNIEKLGGKVELFTTMGAGTTFRLILPLTLAIISSFIVEVAGSAFALPQANVKELILIQPGEMSEKRIEFIHTCPVLRLRKRLLPLVRLADVLEIDDGTGDGSEERFAYFADKNRTFRILVIKSGHLHYGLAVDAVYDTEEILVKPVPAALKACGCYSGVTVLGDGRIAMIIDPESLRLEANLCQVEEAAKPAEVHPAEKSPLSEQQSLLLFKASGGEILGVDLAMVSRVEEIALTRIQKIGSRHYFIFRDQPIRVIRPEHYLPISRRKNNPSKVYIILPKFVRHPVGIIAEEICDAVSTNIELDITGVSSDGIIGTTVVDGTIVTLLNIHDLLKKAAPEYYTQKTVEERKGSRELSGERSKVKKAVILLAEDTPFFSRTIKSYLENEDYTVIAVENGCDALEVLSRQTVDVVISDIEMPHMNGLELVRAIRSSETLRHLPVIALTSLSSDADKERGLRAGFDLYEVKLDRARLLESVDQVLRH